MAQLKQRELLFGKLKRDAMVSPSESADVGKAG
jgi:hypothetical protein